MITKSVLRKYDFVWPLLGSIVLWILIGIVSGGMHIGQLASCAKLATFALILALAQMVIVTSGDGAIDLSQTYILTLCAYISTDMMSRNLILGLVFALFVGCLCGFANGCINVFLKVPAMVTTLATGYIIFSLVLVLAPKMTTLPNSRMVKFINVSVLGIPMLTFVVVVVAALLAILLYRTKYGKNLHCVGQKRLASYYSGVPVKRVVVIAFTIGGGLCGLSGVLCGAFIGGAFQDMGSTYFLPSIAATFVGGTVASGGRSNVFGVCLGALMMSFLTTFLNASNLGPGVQRLIQGVFLVVVLMASVSSDTRQK
jgi:ribose transport system permease protein